MELVIFIGMQASGKSTFYRERFFDTHVRINLDMLRTRTREKILFDACIAAGQPMVIDNTNPTPADRQRYIPAARAAGFRVVGYSFESDLQACIGRNAARAGRQCIPISGLQRTRSLLCPPSPAEGFDDLYRVCIADEGKFIVQPT